MGDTGLEQPPLTLSKSEIPTGGGAKNGALDDKIYPELVELVKVWPRLPEQVKTEIKRIIKKQSAEG